TSPPHLIVLRMRGWGFMMKRIREARVLGTGIPSLSSYPTGGSVSRSPRWGEEDPDEDSDWGAGFPGVQSHPWQRSCIPPGCSDPSPIRSRPIEPHQGCVRRGLPVRFGRALAVAVDDAGLARGAGADSAERAGELDAGLLGEFVQAGEGVDHAGEEVGGGV